MQNKKQRPYSVVYWAGYNLNLGAWINHREDGSIWFNYEIQRSIFLGKDKPKDKQYQNQSLNLNKLEDLCYIKSIIRFLAVRKDDKEVKKNCYVANKILENGELKTFQLYKNYTDKDGKVQRIEGLKFNISQLDILRDFVDYCISQIHDLYSNFERNIKKKSSSSQVYQDNEHEFVDEIVDDEVSF